VSPGGAAAPLCTRAGANLRRMLIRLVPATLASLVLAAAAHAVSPAPDGPVILPDLDQETPSELVVTSDHGEYRLGFRSAVRNVGAGALEIAAHRHDRGVDTMVADQLVARAGGPGTLVRGVGRLRYVVSPDHRHWHLLGFERYELTRRDGRVLVRDRKTGFCLGDRYAVGSAAGAHYQSRCGLGQPAVLGVTQGISPGFGDAYAANLEGQYVTLTGVPAGRYVLVHRVNTDRRLHEQRFDNNAASVSIALRWRAGVPRVKVLARCPDSARCG
jgi:hypothetical protein